jgi:hypothetical protein
MDDRYVEEVASEGALAAADEFLQLVSLGDADGVWGMFSSSAQAYIVNLGIQRGMDFDLASRLRAGVATTEENQAFLEDLLLGIHRDLAGLDLGRVAFESTASPEAPMRVRVNLLVQIGPDVAELQTAVPAGAIILALEDDVWRVERLITKPRLDDGSSLDGPPSP